MFLAKHTLLPSLGDSFQVFSSKLSEVLLLEAGNIRNPNNEKIITSAEFIQQVAQGIHQGILEIEE